MLEDEQQSQSFLADPIWWKCYDQINRKRILNPKSAEYINLKIMFFEIVSYLIFVSAISASVRTCPLESSGQVLTLLLSTAIHI